jgi:hypothetical protein
LTFDEVAIRDGAKEGTALAEDVLVDMPSFVFAGDGEFGMSTVVEKTV